MKRCSPALKVALCKFWPTCSNIAYCNSCCYQRHNILFFLYFCGYCFLRHASQHITWPCDQLQYHDIINSQTTTVTLNVAVTNKLWRKEQESLANAKVSARQPWYIGHNSLNPPHLGTPNNINVSYTSLKSTFTTQQFRRWQCGSIFIRLAIVASPKCEVAQNCEKIRTFGHPRSIILIGLPTKSANATSYWSLIVTLVLSCTVSEIWRLIGWKLRIFPTPCHLAPSLPMSPLECRGEVKRQETRVTVVKIAWS